MNGNRFILIITGFFFLSSCGLFGFGDKTEDEIEQGEVEIIIPQSTPDTPDNVEVLDSIPEIDIHSPEDTIVVHEPEFKESYSIALMLPFSPDANKLRPFLGTTNKGGDLNLIATEYYEGMLMALDTLRRMGVKVELNVFDTKKDSNRVKQLFEKPEVLEADLVIGPVYNACLRPAIRLAKENELRLVSPFSSRYDLCEEQAELYCPTPSYETELATMMTHLRDSFSKVQFYYLNNMGEKADSNRMSPEEIYKSLGFEEDPGTSFRKINLTKGSKRSAVAGIMHPGMNVVIIKSREQSFLNQTFNHLRYLTRYKSNMILVANPALLHMGTLNFGSLELLNYHCPNPYFVDYRTEKTDEFVKSFIKTYGSDPSEFAFRGYDHLVFFAGMLKQYGSGLDHHFDGEFEMEDILFNPIHFSEDLNPEHVGHYENTRVPLISIQEGILVPVGKHKPKFDN